MSKSILVMFFLFGMGISAVSQQELRLTKDKPTVYFSFERVGERKPLHGSESNQGIWLRLHNNSKWAINFCTPSLYLSKGSTFRLADGRNVSPALREVVEVSLCHGVEEVNNYENVITLANENSAQPPTTEKPKTLQKSEPQVGYDRGDVFSSAWLPPGQSIVFSVPREHLGDNLVIFIRFNYEWEYGERGFDTDEPEHRVYFRNLDLPKNLARKNNKAK